MTTTPVPCLVKARQENMRYLSMNLNHFVKFLPNAKSEQLYREYYTVQNYNPFSKLKIEEDGFCQMQMHEFINIFGGHLHGFTDLPLGSMDILIQVDIDNARNTEEVKHV